jgi:hypothetical protein
VTRRIEEPDKIVVSMAAKADLATPLLLHEVHHRVQAMARLRQLGVEAQNLDYLGVCREARGVPEGRRIAWLSATSLVDSARTSRPIGGGLPGCRRGVSSTTEGRATSRGPEGAQAGKEAGGDPPLSSQRARPFLTLLSIPAIRFATSLACIAATILDASVRRA